MHTHVHFHTCTLVCTQAFCPCRPSTESPGRQVDPHKSLTSLDAQICLLLDPNQLLRTKCHEVHGTSPYPHLLPATVSSPRRGPAHGAGRGSYDAHWCQGSRGPSPRGAVFMGIRAGRSSGLQLLRQRGNKSPRRLFQRSQLVNQIY